jgi:hypothetical protein
VTGASVITVFSVVTVVTEGTTTTGAGSGADVTASDAGVVVVTVSVVVDSAAARSASTPVPAITAIPTNKPKHKLVPVIVSLLAFGIELRAGVMTGPKSTPCLMNGG